MAGTRRIVLDRPFHNAYISVTEQPFHHDGCAIPMARPRNFDEDDVIDRAAAAFGRLGYAACSVDDLVDATGLQRGSLYKVFGSKRGLFEQVLRKALAGDWQRDPAALDLMITALREMAGIDLPIAALCRQALSTLPGDAALLLGARLLQHLPDQE